MFLLFGKAPPDAPVTFWKERGKKGERRKEEKKEERLKVVYLVPTVRKKIHAQKRSLEKEED